MKNKQIIDLDNISVSFFSFSEHKEISLCHDRYELLYILSGKGRCISECEEYSVCPGALFVFCPFEYRTLIADEPCEIEYYTVSFDKSCISSDAFEILQGIVSCGGLGVYSPEKLSVAEADMLIERFSVVLRLPEKEAKIFASSLLTEMIMLLSAISADSLKSRDDTLAARVAKYINVNIHRELSLDILSHRFFVSKYYLCRAFKQQSGTSIHNYINRKRVLYAKQLIESGETASSAAEKVGFGDYSAFYRAYTKFLGSTPASVKSKGGCI